MTMDCHHCGNFGHKKYECTSKCRVGCKWCDKPPSRRQITNRNSIEVQRQHSTVNIQRTQGSTSINNGQLSLPQQFSQSTNDVRFAYNGTQGHLQQNVTGNVGNVGNVQQQVPNNIQQLSANLGNLGNLGNLQHHINSNITSNMQNVQVNGTNIQNMNQPTNINNVLFDPTIRPLLQKVLESALLQHHHQQQQQQQHQQQQQQAQVQAQAQHINNTNIYGLQSSNQQQPQLLNTDYLQRLQPSQYLMQQLQQLLNLSANVNNSNVNVNNTNINNNVNNNLANVNVNNSNPNTPNLNIVSNSNVNDSQAASTLVSHITTTIPSPKPPQSLQLSQPHQTSQPQTPQLHPLQLQPPQLQTPQLQPSQLQTQQVQPPHLQTPQVQPPQLQTQQVQLPPQVKQSQLLPPPQLHPPQLQLPQPPQPQLTQIPPQLPQLPQLPHPPPPQQPLQPQQPQLPQPFMPTVPTWNNSQVHVQESQQNLQSNEVIMSSSVIPTTTAITSIKKEEGSDSHMVIERQKTLYQEERSHQGEKTHQKSHQEEKTHREDKTNQEDKFHQEEKTSEQQARNIGETNVEILTKLKELKDKIEKGLHPTIKPKVYNQQIADEERFQIQKETERDSRQNNNRYKENGRQNYFSRGTRGRSPAIEHRSPTNYHRSRRSRSPYRYDKESIISDYRRYPRNRSRSTSLRRDVRGPNEYTARSVSPGRFRIEYDERYFRNSGQDKYIPRGMSMSIYEDPRYGGYGERYEDRSRSFGRSRSPGCRRQNSWYGEQYERERFGYDFRDPEFSARRRPTNRW